MVKRLFDIFVSLMALILLFPVFVLVAVGIKLVSPGPIFFRANRAGKDGKLFTMLKFRSMHIDTVLTSAITGVNDSRIFPFGNFIRRTKIDELPQLINVFLGQMSIVGPRPEDMGIVRKYYTKRQFDTLKVAPGLASPGSLFNYTHGDSYLNDDNPEIAYVEKLLPIKLDLELYYVNHQSMWYDLEIIYRTIATIIQIISGMRTFDYPKEISLICESQETLFDQYKANA